MHGVDNVFIDIHIHIPIYILPGQYTVTQINVKGETCWTKTMVFFAGKPSILDDNSWCPVIIKEMMLWKKPEMKKL